MMKKLLFVLLVSFVGIGNINAQKQKKSMKPKKKECFERPCCGEPPYNPCNDTLNVDTLGARCLKLPRG